MRYLCVHCDKTFEHDAQGKKPRCPSCMRVNGVELVAESTKAPERRQPWLVWVIAGGALAAAGVGYALWAGKAPDSVNGEVPLAPLDHGAVTGHLRHEGVDARDLATLLVPDDAVESWAEHAAGNASGATGKARAIQHAIRERASHGAFERWSFGVPRETPLAPPARVIEWLGDDGEHHHLYPLELAALMTSALRALDVNAMVAEAVRFPDDRSPPDPSGQLGYFVVAVYAGDVGQGDPTYFDPYSGRTTAPEEARVLTDLQAIGAAIGTRALHLLSRESDPERAIEQATQALRLDQRSPTLRAVRGAILIAGGQVDEGVRELQAAKEIRSDAPWRNLLAGVYMAPSPFQDMDAASREVSAALEQYPEFAPGHTTLAAIHLSRQEMDEARTELEEAQRIDPQYHLLPQLWASYYVVTGDVDRAIAHAREAIAQNPADVQSHLLAARIYRQAARYELMRREAHEVLDRTPSSRQTEMRAIIQQLLGPTALDPLEDEPLAEDATDDATDAPAGDAPPGSLTLDSPLLGGEDDGPSLLGGQDDGPSLLGNDHPSLLGGGSQGLQLGGGGGGGGGGGSDLHLNLNE